MAPAGAYPANEDQALSRQSETHDDGPPTRTPTLLSRYGERHLASHDRSDLTSHLGGRRDERTGASDHP